MRELRANGMTFRCREAGSAGEPVVLLHGFPETSIMWAGLMQQLADAGYRCLAPDQRGYSPGARPADVESYNYDALASDVFALADAAGFDRFHLVGHDWGALVGWAVLGSGGSERVASWTAMSVPHALAFARAVRDDPEEQPYRGILGFLLAEGQAEAWATRDGEGGLRSMYANASPASQEEIEDYIAVLSAPGAMTAAASWYRASRGHARSLEDADAPFGPVATPALLLWGKNDPYIRRMSVDLAPEYMTGPYRVVELDAGHWLAQELPERVAGEVLAHVQANPL